MAYTAASRMIAVRHVEDGVRRITALRDSIALRRRDGHPTVLAEKALLTMLQTLELMEAHLAVIEESLARPRGPPPRREGDGRSRNLW